MDKRIFFPFLGYRIYWAIAQNKGKLSKYRNGGNEENIKMSTTYPSVTRIFLTKGLDLVDDFTTMYYIPDEYQKKCPTPLVKGGDTEV